MKSRYTMAKNGYYVEHRDKNNLQSIRKNNPAFKYARIRKSIQAWDDVVNEGTIYPPAVQSRAEFRRFNVQNKT